MISATSTIAQALAGIAEALRTPVLALAVIVLLLCGLEVGRFAMELWTRARTRRSVLTLLAEQAIRHPSSAPVLSRGAPTAATASAIRALAEAAGEARNIELALTDYELAVQRTLDRTRILVRAGPALGLMGTLIPLAPGLAALGHGDVQSLAGDLRTAFAATVVGLLVGTVAYALTLTRARLYTEDLSALERSATQPLSPARPAAPEAAAQAES